MAALFVFLGTFFVLAILVKIPVGFSLGIGAVATFLFANLPTVNMAQGAFSALDSTSYLAIPFFMIAGTLMEFSGISTSLLNLVESIIGRVKGALGIVTIITSALFGVLTGSAMATISAIGRIVTPIMKERGYRPQYIAALLASTCFLGILIPPSVPGIMYALAASESVTKVWMSTIGPGLLFVLGYCIVNYIRHGRFEVFNTEKMSFGQAVGNVGKRFVQAIPALLMPIIIFGGIYGGICTATEAGAISCVYGVIYFVVKKLVIKGSIAKDVTLWKMFAISAITTCVITFVMIFANVATRAITLSGVTNMVSAWVVENISNPYIFLLLVNVIYLIMGTFLDINCSLLLMTPLLLPAAKQLGIDPIHFGAITLVNLSVGFMTPPFANGIFMSAKIVGVNFVDVVKEIWPFLIVGLIVIGITTYVPAVSLVFVGS
jgi:C4-dicarboxylate transporter DctM subunit